MSVAAWFFAAARKPAPSDLGGALVPTLTEPVGSPSTAYVEPPYSTEAIEAAAGEAFKRAFGVARFDYQILGEHAQVLERIGHDAEAAVQGREYFPRRPMLLPKLMRALNDPECPRDELVKLILEDASLAGSVLKQANSAYYRVSPARVDNLDLAVRLLGTEGLKRLMATAITQPVFLIPKGYFDSFAPLTWELAQRAAAAAEAYAKTDPECDPFIVQLLAIMEPLARIVLFRLTMDKYRGMPNVLPRAEVFIRALQRHAAPLAVSIGAAWELTDASLDALREQAEHRSPAHMRNMGRAVYFASLAGMLALVESRRQEPGESLRALLVGQGLDEEHAARVWQAALTCHEAR